MSFYYDIFKRGAGEGGGFVYNQGWKPYVKRVGLFGSKGSYRDDTSHRLNRFQVNQNNLKNRVQDASSQAFVESQKRWTAGTFQDARQEYVEQAAESVVRPAAKVLRRLTRLLGPRDLLLLPLRRQLLTTADVRALPRHGATSVRPRPGRSRARDLTSPTARLVLR